MMALVASLKKSSSLSFNNTFDYLLIAGGGGGCNARPGNNDARGPGGAGGYIANTGVSWGSGTTVTITIGLGGTAATNAGTTAGTNGANSTLVYSGTTITAIGGGSVGNTSWVGGSGYGTDNVRALGSYTSSQGFQGAQGLADLYNGGGGGAGGAGVAGTSGGQGGPGKTWLDGITRGGGGGGHTPSGGSAGGSGGGGAGATSTTAAGAGTPNTGGGGGTGYLTTNTAGGAGGSGVCIIRYPGIIQKATGGVITTAGGYTYHTFNSGTGVTFVVT